MKFLNANQELLKKHYFELADRPFFPELLDYMQMGPVVPMVWEGHNIVRISRAMLGETNPIDSKPGTIRGDYAIQTGRYVFKLYIAYKFLIFLFRNVIHGSDSVSSALKEISLWFCSENFAA